MNSNSFELVLISDDRVQRILPKYEQLQEAFKDNKSTLFAVEINQNALRNEYRNYATRDEVNKKLPQNKNSTTSLENQKRAAVA